jgi:spore coat polysaccharide biosynthesis protein SpsF
MELFGMKTTLIVQARMTSTRLPGKVMKQVLGKPLLFYLIERLKRVKDALIVIATTVNDEDLPIVDLSREMGIQVFRGSEEDVLSRYAQAAKKYGGDIIVRITADCPLIDPQIIDECILKLIQTDCDYVSNTHQRTYPKGMDVEAMKEFVLRSVNSLAVEPYDKEHVTSYIQNHPEKFKISQITMAPNLSNMRLTVDTEEDFEKVKSVIESLYLKNPEFSLQDILNTIGAE